MVIQVVLQKQNLFWDYHPVEMWCHVVSRMCWKLSEEHALSIFRVRHCHPVKCWYQSMKLCGVISHHYRKNVILFIACITVQFPQFQLTNSHNWQWQLCAIVGWNCGHRICTSMEISYLGGRIFGCIWVAAEERYKFRFNVITELVNEC